jgi:hypothetical protein
VLADIGEHSRGYCVMNNNRIPFPFNLLSRRSVSLLRSRACVSCPPRHPPVPVRAQAVGQFPREKACGDIARAACTESKHHPNWLVG